MMNELSGYRFTFLTMDHFNQVAATFREAFADYYIDLSYMQDQVLFNRAVKNGVEFESSVGVFSGDKMVALTLIGIDYWDRLLSAFDAGTGIVPDHRRKGIAGKMFDFAIPKLEQKGVKKFVLEVLQVNKPAIKAYKKAGFEIVRELDSYKLNLKHVNISVDKKNDFRIRPISKVLLEEFKNHIDWKPSWENSFSSIKRIPDEVILHGAFLDERCVGMLVYYPLLNWIMSLVVKREYRRQGIATGLMAHFLENFNIGVSAIKLLNVDHSDTGMSRFLQKIGFETYVAQYEMEYNF